jgi:hypothetical protein
MISKSIVLEPAPPCDLVYWVWIGTVVTGWNYLLVAIGLAGHRKIQGCLV